jgi:hypothetical protein
MPGWRNWPRRREAKLATLDTSLEVLHPDVGFLIPSPIEELTAGLVQEYCASAQYSQLAG